MLSTTYIMTDDFLATCKKHYEIVLFEHELKEAGHSIQSILLHHLLHAKNVLLFLDISSLETILPLTNNIQANLTIINPSAGLLGFPSKGFWDQGDISKAMSFGFDVLEPAYQQDINAILATPAKKRYIRINEHTPLRDDLPEINYIDDNQDIFTLQPYGFSGGNGTIISLGNTCVDSIHAGVILLEKGIGMDIFVSKTLLFSFSQSLQESLQQTEKLIILLDQHPGTLYESYIKAKLFELGLFETEVYFITPSYAQVTTVLPEYIYEQAGFDGAHIAAKIQSL